MPSNNNASFPERLEKLTKALMRVSDLAYSDSVGAIANKALLDSIKFIKRGGYGVAIKKMKLALKECLKHLDNSAVNRRKIANKPANELSDDELDFLGLSHDDKARVVVVNALRADALAEIKAKRKSKDAKKKRTDLQCVAAISQKAF